MFGARKGMTNFGSPSAALPLISALLPYWPDKLDDDDDADYDALDYPGLTEAGEESDSRNGETSEWNWKKKATGQTYLYFPHGFSM